MEHKLEELGTSEEQLKRIRMHIRHNIGVHKKTKLKILGTRARSTLLDDGVSKTHAKRLYKQFESRWGKLKKEEVDDRLRFFTVLDSLVSLNEDSILEGIKRLEARLLDVCGKVKGIEVIGAFEIEIVNFSRMRKLAKADDEARKLRVLKDIAPETVKNTLFDRPLSVFALVHFHGVVDLGINGEQKHQTLVNKAKHWWGEAYQVELKKLHEDKTIKQNLHYISKYLVKGGNENLIYKIGFGYDDTEMMERQMLKSGKKHLGPDFEGFENENSLSQEEIRVLGTAIDRLMGSTGSKNMRNGYLFRYGQRIWWRR